LEEAQKGRYLKVAKRLLKYKMGYGVERVSGVENQSLEKAYAPLPKVGPLSMKNRDFLYGSNHPVPMEGTLYKTCFHPTQRSPEVRDTVYRSMRLLLGGFREQCTK